MSDYHYLGNTLLMNKAWFIEPGLTFLSSIFFDDDDHDEF